MDKKTLGSFIAALRREKGMTQKELAALLHVSDKTVSRWEVGDGSPDLALIPVLAEIFGVTCDELLRGERRPEGAAEETTPLGEKRKQWLMNRTKIRMVCLNIVASVISLLGLLAMFLLQGTDILFGYRIFVPIAFFIVSLAVQAIGLVRTLISVDGEDTLRFKEKLVFHSELFTLVTVICLAISLSVQLSSKEAWWILAVIGAAIWFAVSLAINTWLREKGVIADK